MKHSWQKENGIFAVEYQWKIPAGWQRISLNVEDKLIPIEANSDAEFIIEHYWGYAKVSAKKTIKYEVTHPRWKQYPVLDYTFEIDFKLNYGQDFEILNERQPTSVLLAEGSEITFESKKRLHLSVPAFIGKDHTFISSRIGTGQGPHDVIEVKWRWNAVLPHTFGTGFGTLDIKVVQFYILKDGVRIKSVIGV